MIDHLAHHQLNGYVPGKDRPTTGQCQPLLSNPMRTGKIPVCDKVEANRVHIQAGQGPYILFFFFFCLRGGAEGHYLPIGPGVSEHYVLTSGMRKKPMNTE